MIYKPDYKYIPPVTWSFLTPLYDFFCFIGGFGRRFRRKVFSAVEIRNGMTVADIGCGTGVFLKIAKRGFPNMRFVGLDPDTQALGIAERRLAKARLAVELKNAFAESLPLSAESVDVCFSTLAFHHMPDESKHKAVQEIHRVLKTGGTAVIADFGETNSILFHKLLFFEKIEYLEGNLKGLIPQYLKEAGFKEVRIAGRHFPGIDIVVAEKSVYAQGRTLSTTLKNYMQLNATKLANAVTVTALILFVACTLFVAVAPDASMAIAAGMMHIPGLGDALGDMQVTAGGFILGLISLLVVSYIAAYLVAVLYNRSVKA